MSTPGDRPRRSSATTWFAGIAVAVFLGLAGWLAGGTIGYAEGERTVTSGPATAQAVLEPLVAPSAPDAAPTSGSDGVAASASGAVTRLGNSDRVDAVWAAETAARTGIPLRALLGYAGAELAMRAESPACRLGWNTLAALGSLESGHGTHAGSALDERGIARPPIYGPDLDGTAFARIADTDAGAVDGTATTDRAAGPLQFIPSTWQSWAADGDLDGTADPQQIDDAALAAARYLCEYGDLSDDVAWRRAIFAYNHVHAYVDAVARTASDYAERATG